MPCTDANGANGAKNVGKIVEIKGVVIDAVFPDRLPEIYNAAQHLRPRRATARRSS